MNKELENFFNYTGSGLPSLKIFSSLALLVVDSQRKYCDPDFIRNEFPGIVSAHEIRAQVAKKIVGVKFAFNNASIPVFVSYHYEPHKSYNEAHGGIWPIRIKKSDIVRPKITKSVISGSNIKYEFNEQGIDHIIICGFYADDCVVDTACDLLEGKHGLHTEMKVCALSDCTEAKGSIEGMQARKAQSLADMQKKGGIVVTSEDLLDFMGLSR